MLQLQCNCLALCALQRDTDGTGPDWKRRDRIWYRDGLHPRARAALVQPLPRPRPDCVAVTAVACVVSVGHVSPRQRIVEPLVECFEQGSHPRIRARNGRLIGIDFVT